MPVQVDVLSPRENQWEVLNLVGDDTRCMFGWLSTYPQITQTSLIRRLRRLFDTSV